MKVNFILLFILFGFVSKSQTIMPIYDNLSDGHVEQAFAVDSSGVYLMYKFDNGVYRITRFDGLNWVEITTFTLHDDIYCIQVYQGKLYLGGSFENFMNLPNTKGIAVFDHGTFTSVGTGINGQVNCMTVFHNKLVVGGYLSIPGGVPCHPLAQWDGNSWSNLGPFIENPSCIGSTCVNTLLPINDTLFVGGTFKKSDTLTLNHIAKFVNNNWIALGDGLLGRLLSGMEVLNNIQRFTYYNNELYVLTIEPDSTNILDEIKRWNGSSWDLLAQTINDFDAISCMGTYGNKLFLGGYSNTNSGTINGGAISEGHSVQHFSFLNPYSQITNFVNFNNKLYCTGWFSCVGDNTYHGFGCYDSTGLLIDKELFLQNLLAISPNPFSVSTIIHTSKVLKDITVLIFNSKGQIVKRMESISDNTITLFRDNLPIGIYFISLMYNNNVIASDKLLIVD